MTIRLPAAVLWDMDGTLVDSEAYWIQAETDLVESYGGTWTYEDALSVVGSGLWDAAAILQARGVELSADDVVSALVTEVQRRLRVDGVPFRPGAEELLRSIREAGIPTALVTMSVRPLAEQVVRSINFAAFDHLVTGDEVNEAKPHPEAYLTAATLLGVEIGDCVALEDSITGVESATRSGAVTIAIPHAVDVGDTGLHTRWETLADRTVDDLAALYTRISASRASEAQNANKGAGL